MAVLRRIAVVLALAAALLSVPSHAILAGGLSEYEVKAAFLVNFAKFVEWPATAFSSPSAPIVVAVVGDDPFGSDLDDAIRGKTVSGHPLVARRVDWRDDLAHLHVVFISASEKRRLKDILHRLETASVLSVSDMDGFCSDGGLIAFVVENDRIRFEVNDGTAQRRGLKISSKLLSLATSVH